MPIHVYHFRLLQITNAPITPGIQPKHVRINIIKKEPQPLSATASGGKMTQRITRQMDMILINDKYLQLVLVRK